MSENTRQISLGDGFFVDLQRKNKIYGPVFVGGDRRRVSTGVVCDLTSPESMQKCKELALKRMHKIREEKIKEGPRARVPRPLFTHDWDDWVEMKSATWRIGTTRDVKSRGKHLKEFFYQDCVDEINEARWEKYLAWMAPKQYKLAKHQDYMASFLKYEFHKGVIKRIPQLRNPDVETKVGKYMPLSIWRKVFKESKGDLRLQLSIGYYMGMRGGEIMELAKDRVNFKERMISLTPIDTKTKKGRDIPIHPKVLPMLKRQYALNASQFFFPSPRKNMDRPMRKEGNRKPWTALKTKLGIDFRRHDLRHTCATNFARRKVNPVWAARVLGMTLEVYDKIYCQTITKDLHKVYQ